MDNKEATGSEEPRKRYVWDHDKLAWVEAVEEPIKEEIAVETPREEGLEEFPAEFVPIEAAEEEELEYRGPLIRMGAAIIDYVALIIITWILGLIISYPAYVWPIVGLVYHVGFWSWRGQTPGKMVIRAKVVKTDGSNIGPGNAVLRFLFYLMPSFAPILFFADIIAWLPFIGAVIGLIIVAVSSRKQGLHDMIAGTCVIDTRARLLEPYLEEDEYANR